MTFAKRKHPVIIIPVIMDMDISVTNTTISTTERTKVKKYHLKTSHEVGYPKRHFIKNAKVTIDFGNF